MTREIAILADDGLIAEAFFDEFDDALHEERIALLYPGDEASLPALAKRRARAGVHPVMDYDFACAKILLLCANAPVPVSVAERAMAKGCQVIDASGQWRSHEHSQLCAPSQLFAIKSPLGRPRVWSLPHPALVQVLRVLKPILQRWNVAQVQVQSLQPVSLLYGRAGVSALAGQTADLLNARGVDDSLFGTQMAFNLLAEPSTGDDLSDQLDRQWQQCVAELAPNGLPTLAFTRVSVPVFFGLTQIISIFVEAGESVEKAQIFEQLQLESGLRVHRQVPSDEPISPLMSTSQAPGVEIHGLCEWQGPARGIRLVSTSDNVRTEQAFAALEILEFLRKHHT